MKFRAIRNSWIRLEPFDPAKIVEIKLFLCVKIIPKTFLFNLHIKVNNIFIGVVTTKAVITRVVWWY